MYKLKNIYAPDGRHLYIFFGPPILIVHHFNKYRGEVRLYKPHDAKTTDASAIATENDEGTIIVFVVFYIYIYRLLISLGIIS